MAERPSVTVMVIPDGPRESRAFRLSHRRLRVFLSIGLAGVVGALGLVSSWWYLAARAAQVPGLEERVLELEAENATVYALGRRIVEMEDRYQEIRDLFGSQVPNSTPFLWLPPSGRGGDRTLSGPDAPAFSIPSHWPLTEGGFITQNLADGFRGEHPGIDIAIPTDSYVRAAGAGTVLEVGDDEVYGLFVLIDHGNGYESLYAHASLTFVEAGAPVRVNEIIALTGSTGRSTAPHLHFEVRRDGEPVDPLGLVEQP